MSAEFQPSAESCCLPGKATSNVMLSDRNHRECAPAGCRASVGSRVGVMLGVLTSAERSLVMSKIRGSGNRDTELRMIALFRAHGLVGWRRGFALFGKPDFVFRRERGGALRRRLFLALMSEAEACSVAEESCRMVSGEIGSESGARSVGQSHFAKNRLAHLARVGMRSGEEKLAARRAPRCQDSSDGWIDCQNGVD